MPAIRRYRVTETREILITAENPSKAVAEASVYLDAGGSGGVDGIPEIRTIDISATED